MRASVFYLCLVLMVLAACDDDPDDTVTTASSATAEFEDYETFAVADPSDAPENVRERIPDDVETDLEVVNDAVRDELTQLGLREVARDDDPDLVAFSLAATDDEEAVYWDCVEGYWYGYWTYAWDPCAWLEPVYLEYTVGSIFVGLADPEEEQVVFGGLIEGVVDGDGDTEERIQDDVEEVFDDYPGQTDD